MPIYGFKCPDCHKVSELYVASISCTPPCPCCGGTKMKSQISKSFTVKFGGKASSEVPEPTSTQDDLQEFTKK